MKIDEEVMRACMAAGLTRAQVETMRKLEDRARRDGGPAIGDARRPGAMRATVQRPAAPAVTPRRAPPSLAAVRATLASVAASNWRRAAA